jgi:hypothetical protein
VGEGFDSFIILDVLLFGKDVREQVGPLLRGRILG